MSHFILVWQLEMSRNVCWKPSSSLAGIKLFTARQASSMFHGFKSLKVLLIYPEQFSSFQGKNLYPTIKTFCPNVRGLRCLMTLLAFQFLLLLKTESNFCSLLLIFLLLNINEFLEEASRFIKYTQDLSIEI